MAKGTSKVGGTAGMMPGAALDFENFEQADNYFRNQAPLSRSEDIYVYTYTEDTGGNINQVLRGNTYDQNTIDDLYDGDITVATKALDSAIAKQTLKNTLTVKRGVDLDAFGLDMTKIPTQADLNNLIGSRFTDKGYVSTSVASAFPRQVSCNIIIPKGKGKGIYIGRNSAHPTESEYLIKRNSQFRITGARLGNNGVEVDIVMEK